MTMQQPNPIKIILFALFMFALIGLMALVAHAATIIPQGSEDGLNNTPIPDCNVVHLDNEGVATTQLYVGDRVGNQRRVIDNSAIRGSKLKKLTQDDFSIVASDHFTFSAAQGTWSWQTTQGSGVTATIHIAFKEPFRLIQKEWIYTDNDLDIEILQPAAGFVIREEDTPTSITLYCSLPAAQGHRGKLVFRGFNFTAAPYGEETEVVNDVVENQVIISDKLGEYDLASLRESLLAHYDGNRGEDWASYPAQRNINANSKTLSLDHYSRYRFIQSANTNKLMAANHEVLSIYADGGISSDDYKAIRILSWNQTTNGVDIVFEQDITGYDSNNLRVLYANDPTDTFTALTKTTDWVLSSPNMVHIKPTAISSDESTHFFRIGYEGTISNTVKLIISAPLIIKGDDNHYYQLHINNGVITATQVTL